MAKTAGALTETDADALSPTLIVTVLDAPAESKTYRVVLPFLTAVTPSVAKLTEAFAIRPSPVVTV